MSALTKSTDRIGENFEAPDLQEPAVLDATQIWQGGLVCVDADGAASPGADSATLSHAIGVSQVEALGDAAGATRCLAHGNIDYPFTSSGLTGVDVGKNVAIVDDNTVGTITASTNKNAAGVLVRLVGATAWVKVGRFGASDT